MTEHGEPAAVSGSRSTNSIPGNDLRLKILTRLRVHPGGKARCHKGAPRVRGASTRPGRLFLEIREMRAVA